MADKPVRRSQPIRLRQFRELLQSEWPFRWPTFAVYAVIGISISTSSENNRLSEPSLLVAFIISTTSVVITMALIALLGLLISPVRRFRATVLVLGLIAVGALRGVIATTVIDSLGVDRSSFLVSRVLLSMGVVPVIFITSTFIAASVARGRREIMRTRSAIAGLERERDILLEDLHRADALLITETEETLKPRIDAIAKSLAKSSRAAIADSLEDLINSVVRPLSHALAARATTEHISTESINVPPVPPKFPTADTFVGPLLASSAVYLATVIALFDVIPLVEALGSAFFGALVMWAGLKIFQRFMAGYTFTIPYIVTIVVLTHAGLGLLIVWLDLVFFINFRASYDILFTTTIAALIPGLLYIAQRLLAFLEQRQLSELATVRRAMSFEVSEVRRRAWLRQRHIAHALHSAIQSRVHAEARMVRTGSGPISADESARIVSTLNSSFDVLHNSAEVTPDAYGELEKAIEFWSGMCDIDFNVNPEVRTLLGANPDIGETVLVTCLEVINNAIRHGKATELCLKLDLISSDMITITAVNNGAPLSTFTSGLGMSMFDELTVHWKLSSDEATTFVGYIAARQPTGGE